MLVPLPLFLWLLFLCVVSVFQTAAGRVCRGQAEKWIYFCSAFHFSKLHQPRTSEQNINKIPKQHTMPNLAPLSSVVWSFCGLSPNFMPSIVSNRQHDANRCDLATCDGQNVAAMAIGCNTK